MPSWLSTHSNFSYRSGGTLEIRKNGELRPFSCGPGRRISVNAPIEKNRIDLRVGCAFGLHEGKRSESPNQPKTPNEPPHMANDVAENHTYRGTGQKGLVLRPT